MPRNYWQDKWVKDRMNGVSRDAQTDTANSAPTYTSPIPRTPADKDEYIRVLEETLMEAWKAICDKHLTGEVTRQAFLKLDRRMRELGLLPSPK